MFPEANFKEERDVHNDERLLLNKAELVEFLDDCPDNTLLVNRVENTAFGAIFKDDIAKLDSVEFSLLVKHVVSKLLADLFQNFWAFCNFFRDFICIDYREFVVFEEIGNSGLAACNCTSKTNAL